MRLESRKYLYDIKQAADLLGEFTAGKQFTDYEENSMLRAAVERKFEIIGEALSKLSKVDSGIASGISEHALSDLHTEFADFELRRPTPMSWSCRRRRRR